MKEKEYKNCCVCRKLRAVADSDEKILYGSLTIIYFCAPCLGLEEEAIEEEKPVEKIVIRYLSAKEVKARGETFISIVVKALSHEDRSRVQINEAIKAVHDKFLRPQAINKAIGALKLSGMIEGGMQQSRIEESGRQGWLETYRLISLASLEVQDTTVKTALQFFKQRNAPQQLSGRQIKAIGQTPDAIVLEIISRGAATRKQINQAIKIRWGSVMRHELLEKTLIKLAEVGAIVATGIGSDQRYYITVKRRLA